MTSENNIQISNLSSQDIEQIRSHGLETEKITRQLDIFTNGITWKELVEPCAHDNGILQLSEGRIQSLGRDFQPYIDAGHVIKFVPASGAGTRMFQSLIFIHHAFSQIDKRMLESSDTNSNQNLKWFNNFIDDLKKYPFYEDLKEVLSNKGLDIHNLLIKGEYKEILSGILDPDGLNYADCPKAVMKFHRYKNEIRTALEEHVEEAIGYTRDNRGSTHLHVTVTPEHMDSVTRLVEKCEKKYFFKNINLKIGLSVQDPSTDTIAMELEQKPFRDEDGKLYFRPGGHGALIKNLSALDNDIIFIKNIDNVVHDLLKPLTFRYKKALGGLLVNLQRQIFNYLEQLESCFNGNRIQLNIEDDALSEIEIFCKENLNIRFPSFTSDEEKIKYLWDILNRPLRVCGMVKRGNDLGGGPFWVRSKEGIPAIQIVEGHEVNMDDENQYKIWEQAAYFNPVDIVCGIKDYKGNKFVLKNYINPDSFYISVKVRYGKPSRVLELPGLWNGAMAYWNTVFVEVPKKTFSPIKEVIDLLRQDHTQSGYS